MHPTESQGFSIRYIIVPIYTHSFVGYYRDPIRYKNVPIYTHSFVGYCLPYPIPYSLDLST